MGWEESELEEVALSIREACQNIADYGGGRGTLKLWVCDSTGAVSFCAIDKGAGADASDLCEGSRPSAVSGNGLLSICRKMDSVEIVLNAHPGFQLQAKKWPKGLFARRRVPKILTLLRHYPGEELCGDQAVVRMRKDGKRLKLAVFDGLGHGKDANEAATLGGDWLASNHHKTLEQCMHGTNLAMEKSRGAAVGMVDCCLSTGALSCAVVGNIRVMQFSNKDAWRANGVDSVLGGRRAPQWKNRSVRLESIPKMPHSVLAIFSDGLDSRLRIENSYIASNNLLHTAIGLFESHANKRDDCALMLVALG